MSVIDMIPSASGSGWRLSFEGRHIVDFDYLGMLVSVDISRPTLQDDLDNSPEILFLPCNKPNIQEPFVELESGNLVPD